MKRFTPLHLHAVKLHWEGLTNVEIGKLLGRGENWVSEALNSPEAQEINKRIENKVLDTTIQVQVDLQALAPAALSRKMQLLYSDNHAVANKAATELLELAGHVPTRQVEIRRPDLVEEEFKDKSEQDIRRIILESLTEERGEASGESEAQAPALLH